MEKKRGDSVRFVCQRLIDDMQAGNFIPGDKLTAQSLADRYQVSRTPVREALNFLASDGLLEATPNAGFRVPSMTLAELGDILKIREVLEGLAIFEMVTNGVPEGVPDKLREYCQARENAVTEADSSRYDSMFHMLICESCGSKQLWQLVRNYLLLSRIFNATEEIYRHVSHGREPDIRLEHTAIIEAVEAGNAKLARKRLCQHIAHARTRLLKMGIRRSAI